MAKALLSSAGGVDFISGWGAKTLHASGCKSQNIKKKKKQKQYCNRFNTLKKRKKCIMLSESNHDASCNYI